MCRGIHPASHATPSEVHKYFREFCGSGTLRARRALSVSYIPFWEMGMINGENSVDLLVRGFIRKVPSVFEPMTGT